MALLVLALVGVVVISIVGAAISSRARAEKKSIAGFHQRMGQLSGVVKTENQSPETGVDRSGDLFDSVRSHVKVVGKTGSTRSSSNMKRRPYRTGQTGAANVRRGRGAAHSPHAGKAPGRQPGMAHDSSSSQASESNGSPAYDSSNRTSGSPRRTSSDSRRERLSSSVRDEGVVERTEMLHFDDDNPKGADLGRRPEYQRVERRSNAKVLAAAAVVAVAGVGAIVVVVNGLHSSSTSTKSSVSSSTTEVPSTQPTTPTTVAPSKPTGPLSPTSSNNSGATYLVNSSSITVDFTASAPSWIEESVSPGSKVLWQGILPKGGSKSFTLNS